MHAPAPTRLVPPEPEILIGGGRVCQVVVDRTVEDMPEPKPTTSKKGRTLSLVHVIAAPLHPSIQNADVTSSVPQLPASQLAPLLHWEVDYPPTALPNSPSFPFPPPSLRSRYIQCMP